eukprot:TRINITY_DN2487_c1_g1_i1.p1 TRINITY_DN2487_c1_g1~~TRINITY_DN2487_c1_g1_i1.p1  ORF type:complete len:109 (-),score=7.40 TRINITY_DN2487_c1_g1_i1:65-391(-)
MRHAGGGGGRVMAADQRSAMRCADEWQSQQFGEASKSGAIPRYPPKAECSFFSFSARFTKGWCITEEEVLFVCAHERQCGVAPAKGVAVNKWCCVALSKHTAARVRSH